MELGVGQLGEPLIEAGRSVVVRTRSHPIRGADRYSAERTLCSFQRTSMRDKLTTWHGILLPQRFMEQG